MKNKDLFRFRYSISFVVSLLFVGLIFVFSGVQRTIALDMKKNEHTNFSIIEHIRLNVPAKDRRSWLLAEEKSWEPWLTQKEGFINRQLFWDKNKEEATLLIEWSSREQWKSIPQEEINEVQAVFEEIARSLTKKDSGNPFPITFEGELFPQ